MSNDKSQLLGQLKIDRNPEPVRPGMSSFQIVSCILVLAFAASMILTVRSAREERRLQVSYEKACLDAGYVDYDVVGGEVYCLNRAKGEVKKMKDLNK